jgi:hypothetical protein
MKKSLVTSGVLLIIATFMSCEKDTVKPIKPSYSIEGKWLWSPSENRADANTMYEFEDGNVYTSYPNCGSIDNLCTDADFNALNATDRIPGFDTYTFDDNTLIWDGTPLGITFVCNGGIIQFENS